MSTIKFIRENDFCQVNTERFVEEFGIKRNHLVYVAALKVLPVEEADPYLQRVYVLTHKVTKDGHTLADDGLFLMDPRDLQPVGHGRQEKYWEILLKDYDLEPPVPSNTDVTTIAKDTPLVNATAH